MKKHLPLILLTALTLSACASPTSQPPTYQQVSMQDAIELMKTEDDYVILDVRTQSEYAGGHIPGAILVPNETIGTAEIPQLPKKDQLILVYCRSGNRSKQAAEKLVQLGYTHVVEFGGINQWPGEITTD